MKMIILISVSVLLVLTGLLGWKAYAEVNTYNPMKSPVDFYSLSCKTLDGADFQFEQLKGKRVLIVNTASKCGLTPQYKKLQALYDKYGSDDFVIVGFPANNFLSQEPGSDEEIAVFCESNYGVTFPMMSKISVKGKNMHPVYEFLTQECSQGGRPKK